MALSLNLRKEKTNAPTRGTSSFYSNGNYKPPYGKTKFLVGGKGTSGYVGESGNFAGFNPTIYEYSESDFSYEEQTNAPQSPSSFYTSGANWTQYTEWTTNQTTTYITNHYANNAFASGDWPDPFSNYSTNANGSYYAEATYTLVSSEPGNANYNDDIPPDYGASFTSLGVTFPGGYDGVSVNVTPQYVTIPYSAAGVSVNVYPGNGARVDITNT